MIFYSTYVHMLVIDYGRLIDINKLQAINNSNI